MRLEVWKSSMKRYIEYSSQGKNVMIESRYSTRLMWTINEEMEGEKSDERCKK